MKRSMVLSATMAIIILLTLLGLSYLFVHTSQSSMDRQMQILTENLKQAGFSPDQIIALRSSMSLIGYGSLRLGSWAATFLAFSVALGFFFLELQIAQMKRSR